MTFLENYQEKRKKRLLEKNERLREKNDALRKKGKDPLKGWNRMIDTGLGGGNNVTIASGSGLIDMDKDGKNGGTANLFSEEQKQLGKDLERHRQYDK